MPLTAKPFAVIDIGSNSVRLVVYHALSRVPMPLFNEKYYCALGKELSSSGRLAPDGIVKALHALARFKLMLARFDVSGTLVIATAAIRDAQDGADFAREIEKRFGFRVDIIDGKREAELAANGIFASVWQPSGLCADLGGGSLELARISKQGIEQTASLPIGALRLSEQFSADDPALRHHIRKAFQGVSWLADDTLKKLYAIGGGFRAIAKCHMLRSDYPLPLLHEYRADAALIRQLSSELAALDLTEISQLPGISAKRAPTAGIAAVMLDELLRYCGAKETRFSVAGIREGLLYEQLDANTQQSDPLLASADVLAAIAGRKGRYAQELFGWMAPLFQGEPEWSARLREAFCRICEIAWTIDPNFRAEWAYWRVIQSDMKGLRPKGRIMLALAMYHRYQVRRKKDFPELSLLSEQHQLWAETVGIAANLAFQISGSQAGHLSHAALKLSGAHLNLELDEDAAPLYTETVEKRLEGLGACLSALSSNFK